MATVPDSFIFEEREVTLWTFAQLERLSKANLKQREISNTHRHHRSACRCSALLILCCAP